MAKEVENQDVWNEAMTAIRKASERGDFKKDQRGQVKLARALAPAYRVGTDDKKQFLRVNASHLFPRVVESTNKQAVFDGLMDLAHEDTPWGLEDLSRALKVRASDKDKWIAKEGEDIYPTTGWVGQFVEWSKVSEVPLGYFFWSALSTLGAACRYNFYIDRRAFDLRMNQYIIMVGERALGKTQGLAAAKELIRRTNTIIQPDHEKDSPYRVNMLPEDTNVETLTRRLAYRKHTPLDGGDDVWVDSTGLLPLDELTTFLGKENWAANKRIPWLTTVYGRETYEYETQKGGHIICKNLAMSLLACTAVEWMSEAITPLLFTGGFSDRTIYVYRDLVTERDYSTPAPLDPLVAIELAQSLVLLTQRDEPFEMMATEKGEAWYDEWYLAQPHSSVESGTSRHRRANHLWKVAALLSISESAMPWIHRRHFMMAAMFLDDEERYFIKFQSALHRAPEVDHMKYILMTLRRWGGEATQAKLFNLLRQRKGLSPPGIKAVPYLTALEQSGLIEIARGRRGGVIYRLTKEGWNSNG